ncbi:MAG: VWA domain-containing protein [Planctomycetota bacterium]|jgi:Mg-chelatase subunit ChlD
MLFAETAGRLADWLARMQEVEFLAPTRAWLAIPAILVVIVAPLLRRRKHAPVALSLALRALAVAAVMVVLCEPFFIERGEREGTVVILADVSPSVGERGIERERAILGRAEEARDLVAFGSRASGVAQAADLAPDPVGATDIGGALRFGAAHAGAKRPARLVLMTDGRSTTGPAGATADRLREQGIEIVALGVPDDPPVTPPPVQLRELRPQEAEEPGEVPPLRAVAEASAATTVRATLYVDGRAAGTRDWPLKKGANELTLPPPQLPPGRYHVQLLLEGDLSPDDNVAETTLDVRGAPRVLCITGENRKSLIGEALKKQGMEVTVKAAEEAGALDDYDCVVVLPGANAEAVDRRSGDLAAFVGTRGGGLLAVGGSEGPGLARFADTPTSFLLPVEVRARQPAEQAPTPPEEKSDPQPKIEIKEEKTQAYPITLCLVVDRSGSMQGQKMQQAKIAAASAARALTPEDRFCVIAFGDKAEVVVPPQPAGDAGRVMRALGPLPASGRTVMYAALESAYKLLEKEPSPIRHLVLISDGVPTDTGRWRDLVLAGTGRKITLSCVGIGFQVDRRHLGRLSSWGHGKLWSVVHAHEIPQVVTQDTLRVVRTRNERGKDAERSAPKKDPEKEKKPEPEKKKEPDRDQPPTPPERAPALQLRANASAPREMFLGIPDDELPDVGGIEQSKPRFASWVAASAAPEKKNGADEGDGPAPVVAYRRVGLGTSATLMVDPESRGGAPLREHREFPRMMAQLVRSILPDGSPARVQLRTRLADNGNRLVFLVYGEEGRRRTDLPVAWTLSGGEGALVRRSDRYEADLPPRAKPTLAYVRVGPAEQPLLERRFVIPASRDPERAETGIDEAALVRLAGGADRVGLPAAEALSPPVAAISNPRPLGLPFLFIAAILLPLDAWARRRAKSVSQSRRATPSA